LSGRIPRYFPMKPDKLRRLHQYRDTARCRQPLQAFLTGERSASNRLNLDRESVHGYATKRLRSPPFSDKVTTGFILKGGGTCWAAPMPVGTKRYSSKVKCRSGGTKDKLLSRAHFCSLERQRLADRMSGTRGLTGHRGGRNSR